MRRPRAGATPGKRVRSDGRISCSGPFNFWWTKPPYKNQWAVPTLRVKGFTKLLSKAKREAEEARLVLVVFGDRKAEIKRDRHLPKERKGQPESKPHAGTNCTHFKFAVHRP